MTTALLTVSFMRNLIYAICGLRGMTVTTVNAHFLHRTRLSKFARITPATSRCPTRVVAGRVDGKLGLNTSA